MIKITRLALFLLFVCSNLLADDLASDLGRLPFISTVKISPDGNKIAFLQEMKGEYRVVVNDINNQKRKPITFAFKSARFRDIHWASKDILLFFITLPHYSRGDGETFTMQRIGIFDVLENKVVWPFEGKEFERNIGRPILVNKLISEPDHVLMSYYSIRGKTLYKVNLYTGELSTVINKSDTNYWVTDESGALLALDDFQGNPIEKVWLYRDNPKKEFEKLKIKTEGVDTFFKSKILEVSNNGKIIYYLKRNEESINTLFKAEVNDLFVSHEKVVRNFGKYDIKAPILSPLTGILSGVVYIKNYPEYSYFDRTLRQVQADLKATFPNAEVEITSYSEDKNRFVVRLSGSKYPEKFVLYDRKQTIIQALGDGYPSIDEDKLNQVVSYNYSAKDGKEIFGYLTLPIQVNKKLPPLIVLPHGGPQSRDDMSFDWIRQYYSLHGFAVFQPNFRGSDGYGDNFSKSGHGEWGKKMQSDVDDGVRQLILDKQIDPDKICIVGASYGGYAALYGMTSQQKLYKCGVSFGGVSDLQAMFYHSINQKKSTSFWTKSIGKRTDKELRKYSPYYLASKVTGPILMIHGDKDTIVPYFQSRKLYKKLKKVGNTKSKLIKIEDEDHWLSSGKSRKIFLEESLKFINEHLKST